MTKEELIKRFGYYDIERMIDKIANFPGTIYKINIINLNDIQTQHASKKLMINNTHQLTLVNTVLKEINDFKHENKINYRTEDKFTFFYVSRTDIDFILNIGIEMTTPSIDDLLDQGYSLRQIQQIMKGEQVNE